MKRVYSIGTNRATPTALLSVLLQNKISHLFDIRRYHNSILSRCRGKILESLLSRVKQVEYRRIPELAPSRGLLKKEKEFGWNPDKYLDEIGKEGLKRTSDLITESPAPCFLCAETVRELDVCHRKTLLDSVTDGKEGEFKVEHLDGRGFFKESLESLDLYRGKVYNLIDIFTEINEEYFSKRYRRKDLFLGWEEMPNFLKRRRILAYFRYPDQIIFNPVMDQEMIPKPVIRAVMYHEMLHLDRAHSGLPSGHPVDFYMDEASFREYAEQFHFNFTAAWQSLLGGVQ